MYRIDWAALWYTLLLLYAVTSPGSENGGSGMWGAGGGSGLWGMGGAVAMAASLENAAPAGRLHKDGHQEKQAATDSESDEVSDIHV